VRSRRICRGSENGENAYCLVGGMVLTATTSSGSLTILLGFACSGELGDSNQFSYPSKNNVKDRAKSELSLTQIGTLLKKLETCSPQCGEN